jgi:hypothetical protein
VTKLTARVTSPIGSARSSLQPSPAEVEDGQQHGQQPTEEHGDHQADAAQAPVLDGDP